MADFMQALEYLCEHEGSWTDDPADPGGPTAWGVTAAQLEEFKRVTGEPFNENPVNQVLRTLSQALAGTVWFKTVWNPLHLEEIKSQALANKIFDVAAWLGPTQAATCAQRAARATGHPIPDDGLWGPITMNTLNRADPAALLPALRAEIAGACRLIAQRKPTLRVFLLGWLHRAYI
jgi:lysozyme family protein